MKVYGKTNIFSGNITSNKSEESNKPQNLIVVNDINLYNSASLDPEITIVDKNTHSIHTKNLNQDQYLNLYDVLDNEFITKSITLDSLYYRQSIGPTFGHFKLPSYVFDFGILGSPEDFVIDFFMFFDSSITRTDGTIIYNGLNTGQVDLELNKNFLLTTSDSELIKDPNYQVNPTVNDDGTGIDQYLILKRPYLQSLSILQSDVLYHIAIIRSGSKIYMVINGIVQGSTDAVEYFHYDDVKIGTGYIGGVSARIWNFRISKNTDRGWASGFDVPNYNHINDGLTSYLINSQTLTEVQSRCNVTNLSSITSSIDRPYFIPNQSNVIYDFTPSNINDDINLVLPNPNSNKFVDIRIKTSPCNKILFHSLSKLNFVNYQVDIGVSNYCCYGKYITFDFNNETINFKYHNLHWVQYFTSGTNESNVRKHLLPFDYNSNYNEFPQSVYTYTQIKPSTSMYNGGQKFVNELNGIVISSINSVDDPTHPITPNLPVLNSTPVQFANEGAVLTTSHVYIMEMMVKFTSYPSVEDFFLWTNNSYGSTSNLKTGIRLSPTLELSAVIPYRIQSGIDYVHYSRTDSISYFLQSYTSSRSQSLQLNNWYHIYFKYVIDFNLSNVNYYKIYLTIDDLTQQIRILNNSLILNENSIYNGSVYYDSPIYYGSPYYTYTYYDYTQVLYQYPYTALPYTISNIGNYKLAMFRSRTSDLTVPSSFFKYSSFKSFKDSF